MNKKTQSTKQRRRKSKSGISPSELKQLRKELRECLAGLSTEINKLADDIDEVCKSISGKMEEGLQAYKEKSKR